jgi:hypothetical protein
LKKFDYGGIAVSVGVHDVTPVAPDSFEIEEDEAIFAFRVGEDLVGPGLPIETRFRRSRFLSQRRNGDEQEEEQSTKQSTHDGHA